MTPSRSPVFSFCILLISTQLLCGENGEDSAGKALDRSKYWHQRRDGLMTTMSCEWPLPINLCNLIVDYDDGSHCIAFLSPKDHWKRLPKNYAVIVLEETNNPYESPNLPPFEYSIIGSRGVLPKTAKGILHNILLFERYRYSPSLSQPGRPQQITSYYSHDGLGKKEHDSEIIPLIRSCTKTPYTEKLISTINRRRCVRVMDHNATIDDNNARLLSGTHVDWWLDKPAADSSSSSSSCSSSSSSNT